MLYVCFMKDFYLVDDKSLLCYNFRQCCINNCGIFRRCFMDANDLNVVLAGIGIVFICMILITLVLYVFPLIFGGKNKDKKNKKKEEKVESASTNEDKPVITASSDNDEKELIAVITAAISACLGGNQGIKFRVASFKRVGDNASAWSKTSRLENLSE